MLSFSITNKNTKREMVRYSNDGEKIGNGQLRKGI